MTIIENHYSENYEKYEKYMRRPGISTSYLKFDPTELGTKFNKAEAKPKDQHLPKSIDVGFLQNPMMVYTLWKSLKFENLQFQCSPGNFSEVTDNIVVSFPEAFGSNEIRMREITFPVFVTDVNIYITDSNNHKHKLEFPQEQTKIKSIEFVRSIPLQKTQNITLSYKIDKGQFKSDEEIHPCNLFLPTFHLILIGDNTFSKYNDLPFNELERDLTSVGIDSGAPPHK